MSTFPGTKIPQRVVMVYNAPYVDLVPAVHASMSSWQDPALPDLQIVYYTFTEARAFLQTHFSQSSPILEAWDLLVPAAYKSDLFRVCEIFLYGGVYVDVKCTRMAPYSRLIGPSGTIVMDVPKNSGSASNAFFAAPPGAPWLLFTLKKILDNVLTRSYTLSDLDVTGPGCLGRGFRQWLGLPHESFCYDDKNLTFLKRQSLACAAEDFGTPELASMTLLQNLHMHLRDMAGRPVISIYNRAYRANQNFSFVGNYNLAWNARNVFSDA